MSWMRQLGAKWQHMQIDGLWRVQMKKNWKLKNWNPDRHGGGVATQISSNNSVFQFFGQAYSLEWWILNLSLRPIPWGDGYWIYLHMYIYIFMVIQNIYIYGTPWPEEYPKNGGLLGGVIYIYIYAHPPPRANPWDVLLARLPATYFIFDIYIYASQAQ